MHEPDAQLDESAESRRDGTKILEPTQQRDLTKVDTLQDCKKALIVAVPTVKGPDLTTDVWCELQAEWRDFMKGSAPH